MDAGGVLALGMKPVALNGAHLILLFEEDCLMKNLILSAVAAVLVAPAVHAEEATYGNVYLSGLARDVDWPFNAAGISSAMVCNVNGPDGFLSVRSGPGTNYEQVRAFNRCLLYTSPSPRDRG